MSSRRSETADRAPSALPQTSAFAQLRPTPRAFLFQIAMLWSAIGIGAKEVARWQVLDGTALGEWAFGFSATIIALTLAASSLVVGRLVDRRDPRPFLLLSFVIWAVSNGIAAIALTIGTYPLWLLALTTAVDGVALGMAGASLLKTQVAFVRVGAEGAMELVNIGRLGVGGVLGALLAGASPSAAATLAATGVMSLLTAAGAWAVMRSVEPRHPAPGVTTAVGAGLRAYLATASRVRGLVVIDLLLAVVIPTQMVSIVLSDAGFRDQVSPAIAAGAAGVVVGRIALAGVGFRGDPRRIVVGTTLALAVVQVLPVAGLDGGWIMDPRLFVPIILAGSACGAYAQGLLAGLLQQEVEEGYRGRLGALLITGRNVLVSASAIAAASIAIAVDGTILLLANAVALGVAVLVTGGYRALHDDRAEA